MARASAKDDRWCFACGPANPSGLRLDFELDARGRMSTRWTPARDHSGYAGQAHGGLVAVVLDELMVRLPFLMGIRVVSGELQVRYARPTPVGRECRGESWIEADRGRILDMAAELRSGAGGPVLASARARCVKAR